MKGEDNLDETVFDKFATGELDLPDLDDEESSDDGAADVGADDSELEAYYEELGIDPAEMIDQSKPGAEEKLYKKQKKADVRKERAETAKRERNDIL